MNHSLSGFQIKRKPHVRKMKKNELSDILILLPESVCQREKMREDHMQAGDSQCYSH